jgi:hypothetical protein
VWRAGRARYGRAVPCRRATACLFWVVLWLARTSIAQAASNSVVFFAPSNLSADTRSALEDALTTQLLVLPAALHFEVRDAAPQELEQRMELARSAAREHDSVAVFWLEARGDAPWLLYALDAQAERVVVRPLASRGSSAEAAVEAVALIVRASADALLHGQPLPAAAPGPRTTITTMPEIQRDAAAWPVEQAYRPSSALRLGIAYIGTTFARVLPWQSGLAVRASWLWPSGPYVGIGYTFWPAATITSAPVDFLVERYPFSLHAGLRFAGRVFTFSGELGAEIESRTRRTLRVSTPQFDADPPSRKTIASVSPKLEVEYTLTSWLRIFAGLGIDVVLDNFEYSTENHETKEIQTVVKPYGLRLTLHAGVAVLR